LQKDKFIQSHGCPSVRLFLEWFLETSMFRHFLNTKSFIAASSTTSSGPDSRMNNTSNHKQNKGNNNNNQNHKFYTLFDSKLIEKSENKTKTTHTYANNMELIMKNCRILNKKTKSFKDRFKDLF
jgi:hypothetical protein